MSLPRIKVEITFYPPSEGGRNMPPTNLSNGQYRPHLVVGDPNQLRALTVHGASKETYLGVAFGGGPTENYCRRIISRGSSFGLLAKHNV